ncbi:MAG: CheA signal transduction histidine kinase, partial [Brevundimonas sp.]|nr:CheA signal transduction histidine kinase [Brevundimonas sp.]
MTHAADAAETFRQEAQELLEQIEQGLLDLARRPGDRALVDAVFRGLHTLKGSGAMFGFDALAAFTHHCESAFDRVRKGEVAATPELVAAVLAAQDHMRALAEGREAPAAAGEALLAQLRRVVEGAGQPDAPAVPGLTTFKVRFSLPADALVNGVRPLPLLDELRELGECRVLALTDDLPDLADLVSSECRLAWDVTLTTAHGREAIEDVFLFVIDDMTLDIQEVDQQAGAEDEAAFAPLVPALAEAAADAAETRSGKSGDTVRVPAERLDEMMDRVGELVIAQSRLKQVAANSVDPHLRAVSEEIER